MIFAWVPLVQQEVLPLLQQEVPLLQEEVRLQAMKTFLLHLHLDHHRYHHDFHQVLQVDFLQHFPIRNKKKLTLMTRKLWNDHLFYSSPITIQNINSCLM